MTGIPDQFPMRRPWIGEAQSGIRSSRLAENGRHLGHEPRHFVLYLRMRLQPNVEIEDGLVEPDILDFFQYFSNLRRDAE